MKINPKTLRIKKQLYQRNKRGQTIVVVLWILAVLSITVLSISHQASLGLKLSEYSWNKLRTYALAKAGINAAINILNTDDNLFDSLEDIWIDDNRLGRINIDDNEGSATVSYILSEDKGPGIYYGMVDEERKINLNRAPAEMLAVLFEEAGVTGHKGLAEEIENWRGSNILSDKKSPPIDGLKASELTVPEELLLLSEMNEEKYEKIKDMVTVWGTGKINLNTVSPRTFSVLLQFCRKRITSGENDPGDLAERIIKARPVSSFKELMAVLASNGSLSAGQLNILTVMEEYVDFRSTYFRIHSKGKLTYGNVSTEVECVFDRKGKKMVYWHEN
jgi:type II secretory pathway component PulK